MTYRPIATITYTALALCAVGGCDKPVEVEETPAPAPAQAEATLAADTRLDLEAVVARVSSGEVSSAAELEAELDVDAVAHVDLDVDGKRDELRIVERRAEKTTVFEIRAVPSSKVDVDIEVAPVVAQIELEAKAESGTAVARASWSATFAARAKLDAHATVEHTFTGVVVGGEGRMHVEADANVFVAWAFRPARPVYVAEVFVIHEVEPPPSDPCWPPGHCKHGFWKATGDHQKGRDDATFATGHKELGDRSVVVVHHDSKSHGSKSHDDHAKPSAKKAHHDADHGAKKGGKGSSGKGGKSKGGKGK